MDNTILLLIVGVIALIVGFLIAKMLERNKSSQILNEATKNAR